MEGEASKKMITAKDWNEIPTYKIIQSMETGLRTLKNRKITKAYIEDLLNLSSLITEIIIEKVREKNEP